MVDPSQIISMKLKKLRLADDRLGFKSLYIGCIVCESIQIGLPLDRVCSMEKVCFGVRLMWLVTKKEYQPRSMHA